MRNIQYYFLFSFLLVMFAGCGEKNINKLSPKEIMELYLKARKSGNTETLKQIIYMPKDITGKEKDKRFQLNLASGEENDLMKAVSGSQKVEYENIIDDSAAEVGVAIYFGVGPVAKRVPFQQIVLVKDNGSWKLSHSKFSLTKEQLKDMIKKNPNDADAYYHLGRKIQPENPAAAKRYFRKYYEIAPNGFWVDSSMKEKFKNAIDYKKVEEEMLKELKALPPSANKSTIYIALGQATMEGGDFEKTKMYFQKAEDELKKDPDPIDKERLEMARKELGERTGSGEAEGRSARLGK